MLDKNKIAFLLVVVISFVEATLPVCKVCPVNGQWSQWSDHTSCSGTCGLFGKKVQKRSCTSWAKGCPCKGVYSRIVNCSPVACLKGAACAAGFKKVNNLCANVARADDYVAPKCNLNTKLHQCPCPTGGAWSAWTSSGIPCNATCGMCGTMVQGRSCLSTHYGCPCTGPASRRVACPKTPCNTAAKCCPNQPLVTVLSTKVKECGLNVFTPPILNPLPSCFTTSTTTTTTTTTAACGSGCDENLYSFTNNRVHAPDQLNFTYITDESGCQTATYICAGNGTQTIHFGIYASDPPEPGGPGGGYDYISIDSETGTTIESSGNNFFRCAVTSAGFQWQFHDRDFFYIYCNPYGGGYPYDY
ncbi:unnamed protein product, partial [Mesorhabditis belari]|uniref:Uncharacterized protein n=1 Tax=Mesorhabditis belari TaxID=2138241 RepID=A0AAF3J250_9BILA